MDKNAIKKYAVWARRELIERVAKKAQQYGIEENVPMDANADSINGKVLTASEKKERQALIGQIKDKGYEQVMEEVAYTWFNRFSALRFMEVNGYLPSHVRVFTDEDNNFKPQILTEAIHLEIDGLDMNKVYELKEANKTDELYKYLLITQCNALNSILPGMFQKIDDYTELLFPDNVLRKGSILQQMIEIIAEADWNVNVGGQVEIIGWLYQYYNSEPKEKVFARPGNEKIRKEEIPAATQLFTPDWIVRYMVENSLGKLWIERYKDSKLKEKWKYFLEDAKQNDDSDCNFKINDKKPLKPEEIKCIDPCSGSGHICAYMFDVLMQIYEDYGYSSREAVESIVKNNIYGLDIDVRAAQLAYFSVMMKARQFDRRFLSRNIQPHIYAIKESNNFDKYVAEYFCNGNKNLMDDVTYMLDALQDAKTYGSILNLKSLNFDLMHTRVEEIREDINLYRDIVLDDLLPLIEEAEIMSENYHAVITNPPYMGSKGMPENLLDFIQKEYAEGKSDLYGAFIQKCISYTKKDGYVGLITPYVWMYLSSFEKLRQQMLNSVEIISLIQLEYNAFEVACVPVCTYVLKKSKTDFIGRYIQLARFRGWENQEPRVLDAISDFSLDYCYEAKQSNYHIIDGSPIAYWLSDSVYKAFETSDRVIKYGSPRQGLITGDNNKYMRLWFEVNIDDIDFACENSGDSSRRWFPHSKGGAVRRWYGNNDYIVNWENGGKELKNFKDQKGKLRSRPQNESSYFKKGITWSDLTVSWFSARFVPTGFIFDGCGPTLFPINENDLLYICGYFNSWVFQEFLNITCQGMHYSNGVIAQLPIIVDSSKKEEVNKIVENCIEISKKEWDEHETSWGFRKNVLCQAGFVKIEEAVNTHIGIKENEKEQLRENESKINDIFADIFDIKDITPSKGISEPSVEIPTPLTLIKEFISYAVGCMLGRYSLDVSGVVFAGTNWNIDNYTTYEADKDGIIPICDDEYFNDDIVGLFVSFVETVFGKENLETNLNYISNALGGKSSSREVLRSYFLNDFYIDHCNLYAVAGSGKRPIYMLFDSGKKNGFKALVYMHRYEADTIARLRTDYVHEQQSRYSTTIADLEQQIGNANSNEKVQLNKKIEKVQAQSDEIHQYEEKIHHLADQFISINLDDGYKINFEMFKDVLGKVK